MYVPKLYGRGVGVRCGVGVVLGVAVIRGVDVGLAVAVGVDDTVGVGLAVGGHWFRTQLKASVEATITPLAS